MANYLNSAVGERDRLYDRGFSVGEIEGSLGPKLQESAQELVDASGHEVHLLRLPEKMKTDVLEGQALFERAKKYDPGQMPLQFAVKPPTVWQGQEVEQTDVFGEGTLPEEQPQSPEATPGGVRNVPGGRTIAQELRPRLEREQVVDLRGATVRGPEDLGELAQVYRNPHYETLRIFYMKGDKIIAHEGLTSRLANTAQPFKDIGKGLWKMGERMKRLGADGYYMLHNHPSGLPNPSRADVSLTDRMAKAVPGFRAHVVINHGKFSSFTVEGNVGTVEDHEIQNLDFRAERAMDHPLIGQPVGNAADLALMAKQLEQSKETVTVIFTKRVSGAHSVVTAIQEVPWKFAHNTQEAGAYIRNSMKAFGAVDVFSIAENPDTRTVARLRRLYATNLLRDVVVLKGEKVVSVAEEDSPFEYGSRMQHILGLKPEAVPSHRVLEELPLYEPGGTPPEDMGPPTQGRQRPLYGDPANPNYEVSEPTPLDGVLRKFQDAYVDIRRFVEDLKAAGKAIADELNPVYKEEVYQQKVALQSRRFLTDELEPLVKKMRVSNVSLEDLDAYMQARHVIEDKVNARLRDMNPDRDDNEALSGMTDEEAQAILDRTTETVKRLAPAVDAMLKKNRELRVEYGLDSQETIDAWEETYRFYVPLQREGFRHDGPGTGRGHDIRGSDVKARLGSTRGVLPVLSSVVQARNTVIVRGEKMKPVIALAGLLIKYPNRDIASLAKATPMQYTDPQTGLTEVVAGDIGNYRTPMVRREE